MTTHTIAATSAPALGDIRQAGVGDWVVFQRSATERRDFAKCWEAVGVALKRGAVVDVEGERD
ncbi:hypothetical protein [Streptomyces sp. NBC_01768]|uniref:hypothetical protein n=1 Tax=Streptomyces sp. NBC_01768 TaxID=2975938 RepID=UPI002DDB83E5|nr:hypothetical protein [Streptomyces sp. NBC_01768]WSC31817.1 hypothetical protein OG902_36790 [Streptomyces sp. NBC_01768]